MKKDNFHCKKCKQLKIRVRGIGLKCINCDRKFFEDEEKKENDLRSSFNWKDFNLDKFFEDANKIAEKNQKRCGYCGNIIDE